MLLSPEHRLLFIHIDRTAGSAIQDALAPARARKGDRAWRRRLVWLGEANVASGWHRFVEFPEHTTAVEVKRCLPAKLYAELWKCAFVRNPWDRLVSRYAYLRAREGHRHHARVRGGDFADYLRWEIRRDRMHQHRYVTDRRGRLIVDQIGHFETLAADVAVLGRQLGRTLVLPHTNTSDHGDYRAYYTAASRRWVEAAFHRDIELFGYRFEVPSPATTPVAMAGVAAC